MTEEEPMKRTITTALALHAARRADLEEVTADLDELGLDHVVVGGLAVFHHGFSRFTDDVDIVVDQDKLHRFKESDKFKVNEDGCGPDFWSVEHLSSGVHLDVLVGGGRSFPRTSELQRSGNDAKYVSLNDLVVLKSSRGELLDLGDVERLLQKNGVSAVDWDHVFSLVTDTRKRKKLEDVIERVKHKKDDVIDNPWSKKKSWWKVW
jgi:hypothetical protein